MFQKNKFDLENLYSKGIIVDTNLLILLLVGVYDPRYISKFKITSKYTKKDFIILRNFVNRFKKLIITPHILAELSNLSMKIPERRLTGYFIYFIDILKRSEEINIDKNLILSNKYIYRIGVTDVGIMLSSENNDLLFITDEFKLANISFSKGLNVLHFSQIRGEYILFKNWIILNEFMSPI
ncbi:MAG: hypothetical protein HWN67_14055 [Candidatus Helarchaeota archaeon]|nr:hypothetical protein [Candidatus Helarchaeota archaeon]